jgi:hypothetical protein
MYAKALNYPKPKIQKDYDHVLYILKTSTHAAMSPGFPGSSRFISTFILLEVLIYFGHS